MGSKLFVAFRPSDSISDPARLVRYDFSPGVDASGVEELLNPETKVAYIWHPPSVYNSGFGLTAPLSAMGSVRIASGRSDYVAWDSNLGTGDGRIEKINTLAADNSSVYAGIAVTAPVVPNSFMAVSPQSIEATHKRQATSGGLSQVDLANDQVPTFSTVTYTRTLAVDINRTQYQKQVLPIDQAQRGKTDMLWMQWRCTMTTTAARIWRLVLRYTELEN